MGIRTKMKRLVTFFRRMLGGPYRSSLLKPKNAVNYIGAFEKMLVGEARLHGAEDVICCLIHHTTIPAAYATINGWQRQSDRKIIAISKIISRTTASSRRNARLVSMMSVSALAVSEITVSFRSNASTLSSQFVLILQPRIQPLQLGLFPKNIEFFGDDYTAEPVC
jgi:hypothetical protein